MHHRIARTALCIVMLAVGHAGASAAHPAKPRACGSVRASDGDPVGVVVARGATKCVTARKVMRAYLRSDAPCGGSAGVREHFGWTCASAKGVDWPRLASCSKERSRLEAYAPAD